MLLTEIVLHATPASRALKERFPAVPCLSRVIGDGARIGLDPVARGRDPQAQVQIISPQPKGKVLLKAADLFLMPSKWEGFGLSAAEAMAAGLPVIASRTDGLIDVIDHNANGLLVTPNDLDELTQSIKSLLDNPQKMKSLAHAAQKKAHQKYSINTMIKNYANFYLRLLR